MSRLLLSLLLLLPAWAFAQTEFALPDDSSIQAYLAFPDTGEAPFPLAVVMGGGAGNGRIASGTFEGLGSEFAGHGWAVAVPVSPDGQSFWDDNAEKVRQLIALLKDREDVADGPALLAGISNGGISALEIASNHPGEYLGVVAVPALATDSSVRALKDFPVYLRIGSEDQLGWANRYEATVSAMNRAGVRLDEQLVQGAGHRVPVDWTSLEAWLAALRSP